MRLFLIIFTFILFQIASFQEVKAKTLFMPEFSVTLHNPIRIAAERFKVEAGFECRYTAWDQRTHFCGQKKILGKISANGAGKITYKFDALELKAEKVSLFSRKSRRFVGWVNLYLDGKVIDRIGKIKGGQIETSEEIASFMEEYKDIAYIKIPGKKLNFVNKRGQNAQNDLLNTFDPKLDRFDYKFDLLTKGYRGSALISSCYMTLSPDVYGDYIEKASLSEFEAVILNYRATDKFKFTRTINFAPYNWQDYRWYNQDVQQPQRLLSHQTFSFTFEELRHGWPDELVTFIVDENWERR